MQYDMYMNLTTKPHKTAHNAARPTVNIRLGQFHTREKEVSGGAVKKKCP